MDELESRDRTDLPIACTLDAGDGSRRLARWQALSARAAPSVQRESGALVVAYPGRREVREELEALAAAERQCCAFAQWQVEPDGDHVVLRISSDGDGLAAIAVLFGAD